MKENIIHHEDLEEQFKNTKNRLNKIKMDFGLDEKIDILTFLEEVAYTLNNNDQIQGYMTTGEKITTDYGYVCDLFSGIEEVLLKRIRK